MEVQIRPWKKLEKLRQFAKKPVVQLSIRSLMSMGIGVLLAGASVAGDILPLSVSFAAALGLTLPAFMAYAGGCIGYILFWGIPAALEPMAAGLLVVAASCIFDDMLPKHHRWFGPGCAMLFTGLAGFLFLVDGAFSAPAVWRWALRVAVSGAAAWSFRQALAGDFVHRLTGLGCLVMGLCAVKPWGGLPVGAVAASALSAAAMTTPLALPAAAVFGLATELSWQGGAATAVLMASTLLCRNLQGKFLRLGLWCLCTVTGVLVTGAGALFLVATVLGGLCSLLLPADKIFGTRQETPVGEDPRLTTISDLLEQLSLCLARPQRRGPEPETAAVFDRAAERVCRLCPQWDQCWEEGARSTLEALQKASGPMLLRGQTRRSDFPASFAGKCRRLDALMSAMDRELENLSCRRQYRSRLRESRIVLSRQYAILSTALTKRDTEQPLCRFRGELGIRGQGRRGSELSGDRGSSFRLGRWYYVMLCDGMGTGQGAAGESSAALAVLERLLRAGLQPGEALQILNGVYILRDDGGFSTVDLLQADLVTGQAVLHKWGGAVSYLKRRGTVETIGAAMPPPGVKIEDAPPEGVQISLSRGEILVLVSDGAAGPEAEECVRQYEGKSPKELACAIVDITDPVDDDRTAVAVTLHPCSGW